MKLSVSLGRTINTGNDESLRVDVGGEVKFDPDVTEVEDAMNGLYTEVSTQLQRVIDAERKTKR